VWSESTGAKYSIKQSFVLAEISQVRDLERNESVLGTAKRRNLRWRDAPDGPIGSALFCVFCLGIILQSSTANSAPAPQHARQQVDVLFLSSEDPDLPDVAAMIEQAETRILDGSNLPVHFSFEYLEPLSSFADASRQRATAKHLLQKYSGQSFDLVITINEETLVFTEQIRAKLCPEAALLFFVSNPSPPNWVNREPGSTGVIRKMNYLPTLQLALRQNPGTFHVIVVSGSSDAEKLDTKLAREQFQSYQSNLDFQYLTDLQFSELGTRLANTQPASIILFLDFITDSKGEQFVPARILPSIAKVANAPIYGTFSSVVGGGVVGGSVADLGDVGRVLGNDGARILKGEKPETIPVITGDFQHFVVDWRQLHRWGFSEDELPNETEVRYWEYSAWELYRWRILGLSALLLIETLLIVLLLRSIVKRKRAQDALRHKEAELAEAQRLARVGSWLWNTKNEELTWSEELYRIHGLDPKLPLPSYKELGQLFTPESRSRLSVAIEQALQTGSVQDLDLELLCEDGSKRWVTARGESVRDATGHVTYLHGTVQDITERKRAEEELTKSEKRFRLMADSAPMLVWTSGPDKLATDFNKAWLEFTGRTLQQELGEGWTHDLHPDDLCRYLDSYTHAFEKKQKFTIEYRMRRRDGEYRWMLDQSVPRFLDDDTFAGYVGYCLDISDQKEARAARIELGGRLIRAQEVERTRIARELHDNINQRLALLANGVQELEQAAPRNQDPLQKKRLHELWQLTSEVANDIQQISHQLHPSKLNYLGLAAAVQDLCREFSRQHKFEVECLVHDLPQDLDETVSLSLFRTVQESLHNVVKHSQARKVKVELRRELNVIELRVSDDGIGFNPEQARENHGLGLVSMRERLRSVGGEFSIWSQPSLGTQVRGSVPANTKPDRRGEEREIRQGSSKNQPIANRQF
jgi:PAS domain S-box-containing protein